ncbi:hypothetical protein PORCRE_1486 [Porphyromonas crevioricanis JCM 15906]|uniref:Uncharacterized protein n=1 Tax=Porphyromonas crevioricanis JCM 15906 TaxID=1305617 RepID=T1CRS4_9PORP|nr:hypothetical protein PORCRE_1486 [Porphyromonas crevioricanis JCM 15906]
MLLSGAIQCSEKEKEIERKSGQKHLKKESNKERLLSSDSIGFHTSAPFCIGRETSCVFLSDRKPFHTLSKPQVRT